MLKFNRSLPQNQSSDGTGWDNEICSVNILMISVRIFEPQIPETLKSDSSRLWQFPGNFVLPRACNRSWRLTESHAYAIQDQYLPSIIPVRLILGWSPENKHRLFPYRNNTHRFWQNAELFNIYLRWMKHVKSGNWCAALEPGRSSWAQGTINTEI